MAIELVTGHAGQGHVSSADAGRLNAGICGAGKYVLDTGLKFAYSIESANLIRIASGDAVNQGRHIIIPQNTYEDAALINGTQGKARIDVITLRYSKVTRQVDSQTVTVEEASVNVIKGTEVAAGSTPEVPAVVSGNIFDGTTTDDMPLYHVLITNTSITSVTPAFQLMSNIVELQGQQVDLQEQIDINKGAITRQDGTLSAHSTRMDGLDDRVTTLENHMPVHIDYTWQYTSIGIGANLVYSATKNIGRDGYTPTGIKGYRILNDDTNGKNSGWCVLPKLWIEDNSMQFTIWNQHPNQMAVVKIQIKVEYVSNNAV